MRAQQRHLDIWERFLTNAATRKFSGPRRDPAADKLLAAAAGDGYDDAEAAKTIAGSRNKAQLDRAERWQSAWRSPLEKLTMLFGGEAVGPRLGDDSDDEPVVLGAPGSGGSLGLRSANLQTSNSNHRLGRLDRPPLCPRCLIHGSTFADL